MHILPYFMINSLLNGLMYFYLIEYFKMRMRTFYCVSNASHNDNTMIIKFYIYCF